MKLPRFSVHPFAAAGIFLLLCAVPRTQSVAFVTVTFMHELGHGTAALLLGKRIEKITLMPVGISMKISAAASYAEEIFIAFAGPFENILIIILSPLFPQSDFIRLFSQITLALNLLPMATLDGGQIFLLVVTWISEKVFRKKINPKYIGYVNTAGLVILMGFMVFIMISDVVKLIHG